MLIPYDFLDNITLEHIYILPKVRLQYRIFLLMPSYYSLIQILQSLSRHRSPVRNKAVLLPILLRAPIRCRLYKSTSSSISDIIFHPLFFTWFTSHLFLSNFHLNNILTTIPYKSTIQYLLLPLISLHQHILHFLTSLHLTNYCHYVLHHVITQLNLLRNYITYVLSHVYIMSFFTWYYFLSHLHLAQGPPSISYTPTDTILWNHANLAISSYIICYFTSRYIICRLPWTLHAHPPTP